MVIMELGRTTDKGSQGDGEKNCFRFRRYAKKLEGRDALRCIGFYELVQYGWWVSLFYCKLYDCGFTGFEE
jgi:hypothetical protein